MSHINNLELKSGAIAKSAAAATAPSAPAMPHPTSTSPGPHPVLRVRRLRQLAMSRIEDRWPTAPLGKAGVHKTARRPLKASGRSPLVIPWHLEL